MYPLLIYALLGFLLDISLHTFPSYPGFTTIAGSKSATRMDYNRKLVSTGFYSVSIYPPSAILAPSNGDSGAFAIHWIIWFRLDEPRSSACSLDSTDDILLLDCNSQCK